MTVLVAEKQYKKKKKKMNAPLISSEMERDIA
jgi:hypothetical protein